MTTKWRDCEICNLRGMAEQGASTAQIAKTLGRCTSSIQSKARDLGIALQQTIVRFTDADIERLREMAKAGRSADEIAKALGWSKRSIYRKAKILGIRLAGTSSALLVMLRKFA